MSRRRTAYPSSLPVPRWVRWSVITALLAGALGAAVWWAGAGHRAWKPTTGPDWLQKAAGWGAQLCGGVAWLFTGGHNLGLWGARVACLALLGVTLWAWRRAMLHRNAYKPGPVDVRTLETALPEGPEAPLVDDLTARFRKQLSETELYAPTQLPAEAPADSFLDLVGDVDLEPQNLGTSLLRLTSRLRPKVAYRVGGVLTVRDREPRCGITVTLTSYAIRGSRAETLWEPTWEQAVRKAGYWVASALLPITRSGRKQPWREWRGRTLPADLFETYQRARELGRERKFDEALDNYYLAVLHDPLNVQLRNQIGATQEKLGLHLDALETYFGALNLGGQGADEDNGRLTAPWWNWWRRLRYQRFLWTRPGVLQARYRFAVVLGTSEQTAKQWCKDDGSDARSTARAQIRQTLTAAFAGRYGEIVRDLAGGYGPGPGAWLEAVLRGDPALARKGDRERVVSLIFQRASFLEICRLLEDYPVARLSPRIRSGDTALTRSALRIDRDICAPLRLVEAQIGVPESARGKGILDWRSDKVRWRPGVQRAAHAVEGLTGGANCAETVRRAVRRCMLYGLLNGWQGHYNAACGYALALRLKNCADDQQLVESACGELKSALRGAEKGDVVLQRSWLLFEDPDLAKLRAKPGFANFTRVFYPHPRPDLLPLTGDGKGASDAAAIEVTAYDRIFLESIGKAMERVWHHRTTHGSADVHSASEWFVKEKQIWELIDILAASEARNWRNRRRLFQKVQEAADSTVQARIELPAEIPEFPQIVTADLESKEWVDPERVKEGLQQIPQRLDAKLGNLRAQVNDAAEHSPIKRSRELVDAIESFDESSWDSLYSGTIEPICAKYAATWQAFAAQFPPLFDPQEPGQEDDFAKALAHLDRHVLLIRRGRRTLAPHRR